MSMVDDKQEEEQINLEFEKILGRPRTVRLLDEDYDNGLRLEIMGAPYFPHNKRQLPFEGVEIMSFMDMKLMQTINKNLHKHLFYIKKGLKGSSGYCNAVGYYDNVIKRFTILKDSHIEMNDYFTASEEILKNRRMSFVRGNADVNDGIRYLQTDLIVIDVDFSACIVLGKNVRKEEWKDKQGRTLSVCYPNDFNPKVKETIAKTKLSSLSIIESIKERFLKKHTYTPYLFYIKRDKTEGRMCDAMGYYNPETHKFTIKEGSLLALNATDSYKGTTQGIKRRMFISINCSEVSYGYVMRKDGVCNSPSMAASYVIGSQVNGWDLWIDESGNKLGELYQQD